MHLESPEAADSTVVPLTKPKLYGPGLDVGICLFYGYIHICICICTYTYRKYTYTLTYLCTYAWPSFSRDKLEMIGAIFSALMGDGSRTDSRTCMVPLMEYVAMEMHPKSFYSDRLPYLRRTRGFDTRHSEAVGGYWELLALGAFVCFVVFLQSYTWT